MSRNGRSHYAALRAAHRCCNCWKPLPADQQAAYCSSCAAKRNERRAALRLPQGSAQAVAPGLKAIALIQKSDPRFLSTPFHYSAKSWSLRDPYGVVYRFKNLVVFVRENQTLFEESDTIPLLVSKHRKSTGTRTRAASGLGKLSPRTQRPSLSWKGWTWVTLDERALHAGSDPFTRRAE